jgi:hypothetical protein
MDFALFNGQATWDYVGTMAAFEASPQQPTPNESPTVTNPPANDDYEYDAPQLPLVGQNLLRVLTPRLLELRLINTKPAGGSVTTWNFVNSSGGLQLPSPLQFVVTADGAPVSVQSVGFKRRPLYAPLSQRDLRIDNCLYLELAAPIPDNAAVAVLNPSGSLWGSALVYSARANPMRYNPAIHVNQEGYMPAFPKKAMVGYYLGSMGEMTLPSTAFAVVDANTGAPVFQGTLTLRADAGYAYSPTPYQKVYQADFSSVTTPGEYRLVVPGLGASLTFSINEGVAMAFARAYELGLYHQRCGAANSMPFTRFTHDACHRAAAAVPLPQSSFNFTWNTVAHYAQQTNPDNPAQTAPKLTSPSAQLYPFVRTGTIDTSGGHHDAGDYSKYTINCASLTHDLMFSVDSLAGVAELDNLGIPESGDGISDILQEAKWEADFLAKIQDNDGGFYFLVYPRDREYESNVTPDFGDAQVVWPKTTSATAAAVAALAQCASSPLMKQKYPQSAALYLQKAQLGWQFLMNAIAQRGKAGAYQKITHYGDDFAHDDELAWAACEMFLATGDPAIHQTLKSWLADPADPATFRWGWWRLYACYGNAVRSYAFAARSGRLPSDQLDASYLAKCVSTITNAGNDNLRWSQQGAYGTSFPEETKRVRGAGWYFSASQAFDIATAYQLNPRPEYLDAMLANMNYEGGCNPVNVTYVTGLGWKRQREIVHQYSWNDRRTMPPSGIPIASVQQGFVYTSTYGTELAALTYPFDDANTALYPFYDRWGDTFNVTTEFVVTDQARGLGTVAFLAALTPLKTQPWSPPTAQILGLPAQLTTGTPVTATLQVPGMDLNGARILWEANGHEPAYGETYTFTPSGSGAQWVEVEVQWLDGRRVFGASDVTTANGLPTVSISSGDSYMTEGVSGDTAVFTISRIGSTAAPLMVTLQPSGTATKWNDYRRFEGDMPEVFTIPAGQSSIAITVYAATDGETEGTETGALTLLSSPNYNRGTPDAVALTIQEGASGAASLTVSSGSDASRVGPANGTFTITRSGSTASPLMVNFILGGSALNGVDYNPLPGSITIPAGATAATVSIVPKSSATLVGNKDVSLILSTAGPLSTAQPGSATMTIGGNSVRSAIRKTPGGMNIAWIGNVGKTYRISSRASLLSGTWTDLTGNIMASSPYPSWTDTTSGNASQRFYIVYQVD